MSEPDANLLRLRPPTPSLAARVQRKCEVLQLWLDEGVPHEKLEMLPRSLNQAREWEDIELGIYRIGSPNNFTTTHLEVGEDVEKIDGLLSKLESKLKRPQSTRPVADAKPKISARDIERAFSALISQWHMAREEARQQRVRADTAEKHRDIAREELRGRELELAELRRRVAGGLTLIK